MPYAPELQFSDEILTDFAAGYSNGRYFAERVLPIVPVNRESGSFQTLSREDFTTPRSTQMASGGEANTISYTPSSDSYTVLYYAQKAFHDQAASLNNQGVNVGERLTALAMNALLLDREIRVADLLDNSSNYASSNTSSASSPWSDTTNGAPLDNIQTAKENLAHPANDETRDVLILALEAWHELRKHPQMLGGGMQKPQVSREEAAEILDVDEIIVSDARKDTANYGASASYSRIWDTGKFRLLRLPAGEPSDETGLFAATFRLQIGGGSTDEEPVRVRTWREERTGFGGSDYVQAELAEEVKVVQNDLAYMMDSI